MPLRPELEPLPERMQRLPLDKRNYPVPAFVAWVNGEPEFRAMDPAHWARCITQKLCWVCGSKLGRYLTFVTGPMCAINRTTSEPPCHKECAQWSARNCPFLTRPHMVRREDGLPEALVPPGGIKIARNPGVCLLWTCRSYEVVADGKGGKLIEMGGPSDLEWWAEGRPATDAEIDESIRTGLPILEEVAATEEGGTEALRQACERFDCLRLALS